MDLDVSTTAKFAPAPATDEPGRRDGAIEPDAQRATEPPRERRSIITTIATTASRRWKATLAFFVVVVLAGGYSFGSGLDREGFPPINTPISIVTGTYFVDDIDQVDADVTQPLADAFAGVEGVVSTEAQARAELVRRRRRVRGLAGLRGGDPTPGRSRCRPRRRRHVCADDRLPRGQRGEVRQPVRRTRVGRRTEPTPRPSTSSGRPAGSPRHCRRPPRSRSPKSAT